MLTSFSQAQKLFAVCDCKFLLSINKFLQFWIESTTIFQYALLSYPRYGRNMVLEKSFISEPGLPYIFQNATLKFRPNFKPQLKVNKLNYIYLKLLHIIIKYKDSFFLSLEQLPSYEHFRVSMPGSID